jgi:signal transduction histidine kinase
MPLLTTLKPAAAKPPPMTASLVVRCILGLATIAIGTSAYFSYRTLRDATLKTLQQNALAEVKNSTQNLDHWLGNLETRVEMLANGVRPDIAIVKHYGNFYPITGYAGQLNQVFMNILANAIDAMEESSQNNDCAYLAVHPNQITLTTETIEQGD